MKPGLLLAAGETWSVENGSATLLVALTPADGRRLWQHQLPGVAGWGRAYPDAVGGTTLAPGDFCIQSAYKFYWWKQYDELLAWDLSTGKLAWKRSAHTYELTETTDGGIIRGVRLRILPRTHIERLLVNAEPTPDFTQAKVSVRANIYAAENKTEPADFTRYAQGSPRDSGPP